MITYEYECKSCEHVFEIQHSIKDKPKKKCPNCKKKSLERIIFPSYVIDKTPKTVGSFIDKKQSKKTYEEEEKRIMHTEEMKLKREQGLIEVQKKLPKGMKVIK